MRRPTLLLGLMLCVAVSPVIAGPSSAAAATGQCTITNMKNGVTPFESTFTASVKSIQTDPLVGGMKTIVARNRAVYNNIPECGKGRYFGRITTRRAGKNVLIAKADKAFDYGMECNRYCARGALKMGLTKGGRKILVAALKAKQNVKVTASLREYDTYGDSYFYSTLVTLKRLPSGGGGGR